MKKCVQDPILVFGRNELLYSSELPKETQEERVNPIISEPTPVVVIGAGNSLPKNFLLIERGHRLISDDLIKLDCRKSGMIEGGEPDLNKHIMDIRRIAIINVARLYGAVCFHGSKSLDLIVKLEESDDQALYDRIGLNENFSQTLGVNIPFHILPVKPRRDLVVLIETIVLNHRLKMTGYHSAREFKIKLLETISWKQKESEAHSKS